MTYYYFIRVSVDRKIICFIVRWSAYEKKKKKQDALVRGEGSAR